MLKYRFKIAFRSIMRDRMSSFINVVGMGVGLAATVLIYLYISYEENHDRQLVNSENVYQVMVNTTDKDRSIVSTIKETPNVISSALNQEVPEIQAITHKRGTQIT
jgi:putative ABC transport system permease protein